MSHIYKKQKYVEHCRMVKREKKQNEWFWITQLVMLVPWFVDLLVIEEPLRILDAQRLCRYMQILFLPGVQFSVM